MATYNTTTTRARASARRRLDSRAIVLDCLACAERMEPRQPSMAELCRAASVSESTVRRAFIEVFAAPPRRYFQNRLLTQVRDELLLGDPVNETVTRIASSLGVTQFGRMAGRYRRLFDELPSETLHRRALCALPTPGTVTHEYESKGWFDATDRT